MNPILVIAHLTLHEASRKRVLIATLICGAAFLTLYATGFYFAARDIRGGGTENFLQQRSALAFLTLAGLYVSTFLVMMTSVLLPVDTLSGEIGSGVAQTLASKPIRRSDIVLGKWLAYALVSTGYATLLIGGVLTIARVIGHWTPPGLLDGLPLLWLEAQLFVALSFFGGARFSTVTNGIVAFGLYGLAFIGNWVEQIGAFMKNDAARMAGTVASLLMPTESLWARASWHMQPTIMRELNMSPFSPASVPSPAMVAWAVLWGVVVLALAVRGFAKRPL
jgi:Cu-processing system permease protein